MIIHYYNPERVMHVPSCIIKITSVHTASAVLTFETPLSTVHLLAFRKS